MNKLKKVSVATIAGLAIFGTTVFASTGKVYNTSQGLVLRGEASKSGAPLATIPNDKEFEIIEELGEWYKVNVDGKEGYLFAEYVEVQNTVSDEKPTPEEPVDTTTPNTTKTETRMYMLPLITSSTIETIPANTELNVIKTLNNWAYVSYNNVNGWIRTYNYNEKTVEEEQPEEPTEPENNEEEQPEEPNNTVETNIPAENTNLSFTRGYINESSVNVRKEPNTNSEVVTILILNTGVTISAQTDEWYKVTYGDYEGYVYKPLISETPIVTNRGDVDRTPKSTTDTQEPTVDNSEDVEDIDNETIIQETPELPSISSNGNKIVSFAKQYLGYRYVLGGTTPGSGFDCSGFVYYVFNSNGYSISRSLYAQASTGTAVSKSELQPGDVVFFNNTSSGSLGHVGIYIGDGMMVHAANSKRGVVTDTINSGYYNTYYYSARRIAN